MASTEFLRKLDFFCDHAKSLTEEERITALVVAWSNEGDYWRMKNELLAECLGMKRPAEFRIKDCTEHLTQEGSNSVQDESRGNDLAASAILRAGREALHSARSLAKDPDIPEDLREAWREYCKNKGWSHE